MASASSPLTTRKLLKMALAKTLKAAIAPSTEAAYARTISDLADAKRVLAGIVSRLVKAEANQQRRHGDTDSLYAERAKARALVAQLERQGGELKAELIAARPKPPLTPLQQAFADAAKIDPHAHIERGSPEKIAAAQAELDALVREYKLTTPTSGAALDAWAVRKNAARTKLEALKGPPYPPHRPWASAETLAAARKAQGFKS
jgi:hypothetical protein